MRPNAAAVRPESVIKISWHGLIAVAVAIKICARVIVKAVVAPTCGSVAVEMVVVVATGSSESVVAGIVATWRAGVIRQIGLADLYTQASRSERKSLCFYRGSIFNH